MADFQFYVTDDRYGVRTVMFVQTRDAKAARSLAERIRRDNEHHRMIEAYDGEELLFTVGSEPLQASPPRLAQPPQN